LTAPFRAEGGRLRGLLRRLRRDPLAAAHHEILSRFARCTGVREVPASEIEAIARRHAVPLEGELRARTIGFYRDFLRHCLADRRLTNEELADLEHLRAALRLDDNLVQLTHRRIAREIYSKSVNEVLTDATIDPDERVFLMRLRDTLGVPETVAENIEHVKVRQRGARDAVPPKRMDGPRRG
jgi:hypothetical protein